MNQITTDMMWSSVTTGTIVRVVQDALHGETGGLAGGMCPLHKKAGAVVGPALTWIETAIDRPPIIGAGTTIGVIQ